jgi:hypothetical protein
MKNFTLLKPLFTQGFLVFLVFFVVIDLLLFRYMKAFAPVWFIFVTQITAIIGYVVSNGFGDAGKVVWDFAKKWWPDNETEKA